VAREVQVCAVEARHQHAWLQRGIQEAMHGKEILSVRSTASYHLHAPQQAWRRTARGEIQAEAGGTRGWGRRRLDERALLLDKA